MDSNHTTIRLDNFYKNDLRLPKVDQPLFKIEHNCYKTTFEESKVNNLYDYLRERNNNAL